MQKYKWYPETAVQFRGKQKWYPEIARQSQGKANDKHLQHLQMVSCKSKDLHDVRVNLTDSRDRKITEVILCPTNQQIRVEPKVHGTFAFPKLKRVSRTPFSIKSKMLVILKEKDNGYKTIKK
ncbi:MAG: hypothetical protein MSIBF_04435 [Candidatus Altiarchaeales archaeon IMC4]|nr:MAG: hypothetical protein MSIBF_04435 [Candidatus Altiarchaeales archaeon IMC4]